MRYVTIQAEIPVAETPEEIVQMLQGDPELMDKVQAITFKVIAKRVVAEAIADDVRSPRKAVEAAGKVSRKARAQQDPHAAQQAW